MGIALSLLGRTEEALDQLREAARLDPSLDTPLYAMARAFGKTDEADSSIYYLDKAIEIDPRPFKQVIASSAFNVTKSDPRFADLKAKHDRLMKRFAGDAGEDNQ